MSSMVRKTLASLLLTVAFAPLPVLAQGVGMQAAPAPEGAEWDQARAQLRTGPASAMVQTIERWKMLNASDRFSFNDYASFLLSYPGFPEEAKFRVNAERALERESADPARIAAYFQRFAPVTNTARANHAMALFALGRSDARSTGRDAWRGGVMSDNAEAFLSAQLAGVLTPDDHDARMDALLWATASGQAERQLLLVSPARRGEFMARMGLVNGSDPLAAGLPVSPAANSDPGYLYNRARMLRTTGRASSAANLLATRPPLRTLPLDQRRWLAELLAGARGGDGYSAVRIASTIDDAFTPGTDVSRLSFQIRDDYTSLMWLGGTACLGTRQRRRRRAAVLALWRSGTHAPDPLQGVLLGRTRDDPRWQPRRGQPLLRTSRRLSRAVLWPAGAGTTGCASTAFQHGPRRGPEPRPSGRILTPAPLTMAVREVARESDWPTAVRFFREISDPATTEVEHVMVADLAREIGRRDLGVILGQSAHTDGFGNFQKIGFPLLPLQGAQNWTMVHAITRQESQFAMNAISHAGARGLMQLMPGTAREQAGKLGLAYMPAELTRDAGYNIALGDAYFGRMMDYFGGSYPLAVAAYNAGPGNVNKWLRANGDPRQGGIEWIDWIEKIPLSETRNYVQRVLENAVVYDAMNPGKARYKGSNPLSFYIGKRVPG